MGPRILRIFSLIVVTWLAYIFHRIIDYFLLSSRIQRFRLNIFYCIRYKFFNLEHLLLYINNIQIQLNINTQKLQSFLIIRKNPQKTATWNKRVQHNLIFAKWQIEQTFTLIGLVYRTHLAEWRKSIIVLQCSGIINSVKVGSFKI